MSLLSVVKIKLGQAADSAKNFFWDASATDGSIKLVRESDLANPLVQIQANDTIAFPKRKFSGLPLNNRIACRGTISPAFAIPPGATQVGTNLTLQYDYGNSWNVAAKQFKPSVAGVYRVSMYTSMNGGGTVTYLGCYISKNGTETITAADQPPYSGIYAVASCSGEVYLNGSTDFITFFVDNGAIANGTLNTAAFSATLILEP